MSINLNSLARQITLDEGLHEELSIAQVKEVLRLTLEALAQEKSWEVLKLLEARAKPSL